MNRSRLEEKWLKKSNKAKQKSDPKQKHRRVAETLARDNQQLGGISFRRFINWFVFLAFIVDSYWAYFQTVVSGKNHQLYFFLNKENNIKISCESCYFNSYSVKFDLFTDINQFFPSTHFVRWRNKTSKTAKFVRGVKSPKEKWLHHTPHHLHGCSKSTSRTFVGARWGMAKRCPSHNNNALRVWASWSSRGHHLDIPRDAVRPNGITESASAEE